MSGIRADKLKSENIAEYIVHMYQTEDLIISYDFNLDDINKYVIKQINQDDKMHKKLLLWYAHLIEQMGAEEITSSRKRLKSTQDFVRKLSNLHLILLNKDMVYQKIYDEAKTNIDSQILLSEKTIADPVQICLNGIYGMLLLRLNGMTITPNQSTMLKAFGKVLAYLSRAFRKVKS